MGVYDIAARSALNIEQTQEVDQMPTLDASMEGSKLSQNEFFTKFLHCLRRIRASGRWSEEHWLLALIPGTYFAVTNYLQHAFVTTWFGSSFSAALTAIAFLLCYNVYALVVRAQWRLVNPLLHSQMQLGKKAFTHFAFILVAGSFHLLLISLLTAVTREGASRSIELGFYFQEIWVSCMPIWGLLYLLTLGVCIYFQSVPAEELAAPKPAIPKALSRIAVRDKGKMYYIEPTSIRRIEAEGDYVKLYSDDDVLMPKGSITRFEKELKSCGAFLRVHRSCILRTDCIKSINRMRSGAYRLELDDGQTAPLSRHKISLVRRMLEGEIDAST